MAGKKTGSAADRFGELAIALHEEVESIVSFWRGRDYHPEWKGLMEQMPGHLRAFHRAWREAEEALSRAEADLHFDQRPKRAAKLKAAVDEAKALRDKALKTLNDSWQERCEAENEIAREWLEQKARSFDDRRRRFALAFEDHQVAVAGLLEAAELELGKFAGASASETLLNIANHVAKVLEHGPEPGRSMAASLLAAHLDEIDWDALRSAIRREVGRFAGAEAQQQKSRQRGSNQEVDEIATGYLQEVLKSGPEAALNLRIAQLARTVQKELAKRGRQLAVSSVKTEIYRAENAGKLWRDIRAEQERLRKRSAAAPVVAGGVVMHAVSVHVAGREQRLADQIPRLLVVVDPDHGTRTARAQRHVAAGEPLAVVDAADHELAAAVAVEVGQAGGVEDDGIAGRDRVQQRAAVAVSADVASERPGAADQQVLPAVAVEVDTAGQQAAELVAGRLGEQQELLVQLRRPHLDGSQRDAGPRGRVVLVTVAVEVADDGTQIACEGPAVGQDRPVGAAQDPHREVLAEHAGVDPGLGQQIRPPVPVEIADRIDDEMIVLRRVELPQQLLRGRATGQQRQRERRTHYVILTQTAGDGVLPEPIANIM